MSPTLPAPAWDHRHVDRDGLAGDVEVLQALLRRRDGGRRVNGRWDDGHRIAAVVGGGGMRGAYTGGMAHALHDAGLEPFFDVVYGSSAGAYVGAALVLGDGRGAGLIFHEDMACRAFADPRRLGTRRPVVSLDHLIDEIMVSAKPVPWERLRDATVSLRVIATAVDDLTPHVLEPRTVAEWRAAMRATAAIPYLAGPAVELHGRRWIDGSVTEPLPVPRALTDGATDVLVLLNRTVSGLRRQGPAGARARWTLALDRVRPGLGAIAQHSHRLGPVLEVLGDPAHPARAGRHVLAVAPVEDAGVRGLTTDPKRVERAARLGYAAMAARLTEALTEHAAAGLRQVPQLPDNLIE
jgi:predicted patatin/cPLA2 family phospholipase